MTRIVPIDSTKPQTERLEQARQILADGGLVIVPTETVYGIACDPAIPTAMEKLIAAKGRDGNKPIARLASSAEQVAGAASDWNEGVQALAAKYWPGPLTIVLKTAEGWTGYRVPNHSVTLALAKRYNRLLALTSANLSGEPDPGTAREAMCSVSADLVLDSGPSATVPVPSTVIKVDGAHIECLREGCIPFREIERFFKHQRTEISPEDVS